MIFFVPDSLVVTENLIGIFLYLVGMAGSYFRYEQSERRGRLDSFFLIAVTWGFSSLMIGVLNIVKYNYLPTMHLEVIRAVYYVGAGVTSLVFFSKNHKDSMVKTRISAMILMGALAFTYAEALVFYLDLTYPAAIFSSVGFLMIYCFLIIGRLDIRGILMGTGMLLIPILPTFMDNGLDLEGLDSKRKLAVNQLMSKESEFGSSKKTI